MSTALVKYEGPLGRMGFRLAIGVAMASDLLNSKRVVLYKGQFYEVGPTVQNARRLEQIRWQHLRGWDMKGGMT